MVSASFKFIAHKYMLDSRETSVHADDEGQNPKQLQSEMLYNYYYFMYSDRKISSMQSENKELSCLSILILVIVVNSFFDKWTDD